MLLKIYTFLGKYIPVLTPGRYVIVKNLISQTGMRGMQMGMGIVSTYFIARSLSKNDYGEYSFILSVVSTLSICALPGLTDSVMQSVARGFKGIYREAVPLSFKCAFIGSVIMLCIAAWYSYADSNHNLALGLCFAAVIFPVYSMTQWKALRTGAEKFTSLFWLDGGMSVVTYSLMIAMTILWPGHFFLLVIFVFGIPAAQNCIQTWRDFRKIPAGTLTEEGSLAYGVKTTFIGAFHVVAQNADKLILFTFLSPAMMATYVAADKIAEWVRSFSVDIGAVMAPRFARQKGYSKGLDKGLKIFAGTIAVAIAVFAFTLMPWMLEMIFGEKYHDSIPYAQALMFSVAFSNLANLRLRFMRSQMDAKGYRDVLMVSSSARVVSSLILIPLFHLTGAVISNYIFRISMSIVVYFIFRNRYSLKDNSDANE